jgi:hypothetical protein
MRPEFSRVTWSAARRPPRRHSICSERPSGDHRSARRNAVAQISARLSALLRHASAPAASSSASTPCSSVDEPQCRLAVGGLAEQAEALAGLDRARHAGAEHGAVVDDDDADRAGAPRTRPGRRAERTGGRRHGPGTCPPAFRPVAASPAHRAARPPRGAASPRRRCRRPAGLPSRVCDIPSPCLPVSEVRPGGAPHDSAGSGSKTAGAGARRPSLRRRFVRVGTTSPDRMRRGPQARPSRRRA